jgi:hypothetical protein
MMIYGVTGTQKGATAKQLAWLEQMLEDADALHHGACIGVDAASHGFALKLEIPITVHPGCTRDGKMPKVDLSCLIELPNVFVLPKKEYLLRNRDIVAQCEFLLVLPSGPEQLRSGTWSTVRYARSVDRPRLICYPDGTVSNDEEDTWPTS